MNNKHDSLILIGPSGLGTAPHLATRILILRNGEWRSMDIRFELERSN